MHDHGPVVRVQCRGRLVGQHDARRTDDDPRDGDALLLAAAQRVHEPLVIPVQMDDVQRASYEPASFGRRHADAAQGQLQVLSDGPLFDQRVVLEHEPHDVAVHEPPCPRAPVGQVACAVGDDPAGGPFQQTEHVE